MGAQTCLWEATEALNILKSQEEEKKKKNLKETAIMSGVAQGVVKLSTHIERESERCLHQR